MLIIMFLYSSHTRSPPSVHNKAAWLELQQSPEGKVCSNSALVSLPGFADMLPYESHEHWWLLFFPLPFSQRFFLPCWCCRCIQDELELFWSLLSVSRRVLWWRFSGMGRAASSTFPSGPDWERKARLQVVCCSIINTCALAVWIGYSAVALSGGKRESHGLLLVEEKGIVIFPVIFILSLVWCFLDIFLLCFLGDCFLFLVLFSAPLGGWRNTWIAWTKSRRQ